MEKYSVLITAPSLDEQSNVSGISTVVRNIIEFSDSSIKYFHFKVGKQDKKKRSISWVIDQMLLIPRLIASILKLKIQAVHLNTGFEAASLNRDFAIFFISKYLLRKKVIFHVHGGYYLMNPPKKHTWLNFIIYTVLKNADVVIVLSNTEKKVLQSNYLFNNCFALPNSVDIVDVKLINKNFTGPLNICFLGRIVNSKGVFVIVDAFKALSERFKEFSFHLYGTGPELNSVLEGLNGIPGLNFNYHGVIGGARKWEVLTESHVFLLPSLFGEGLPMALLEAMNFKCVPVVTNDASMAEVIQNGANGFVVGKGDVADLTSAISNILDRRELLPAVSDQAHETIVKKYGMERYIVDLNNIYAVTILY